MGLRLWLFLGLGLALVMFGIRFKCRVSFRFMVRFWDRVREKFGMAVRVGVVTVRLRFRCILPLGVL